MSKVLILAGDAAEDLETMFIKYRLAEARHEPHVAAPTTRPIKLVGHFFAEEKPVGTLCHGPQVPAALGLLRGRRSSGFGPLAPEIEMAGGEYVDGAAVVDGDMVSCRGWGDLAEWSRAFMEVLDRAAVPV